MIINSYTFAQAIVADTILYRVNCGGSAVTAIDGEIDWSEDTQTNPSIYTNANGANGETNSGNNTYSSGSTFPNSAGFPAPAYSDIVDLWKVERYDGTATVELNYVFPATNGNYTVNLGFAELFHTAIDKRKFHVDINGVRKLDNLDNVAKYGGRYYKGWESFPVTVSNSELRIEPLKGAIDSPKINLIEIIQHGV